MLLKYRDRRVGIAKQLCDSFVSKLCSLCLVRCGDGRSQDPKERAMGFDSNICQLRHDGLRQRGHNLQDERRN
ncbi:MAG TPA: hypothetical protein VES65_01790 [Solirubrobacteraceae bacterium]|nr:hypothetical protein [Solirubrobacteraceae bacterium]